MSHTDHARPASHRLRVPRHAPARLIYFCCEDFTIIQVTACGRQFPVCTECDNGINECTEGECDHD